MIMTKYQHICVWILGDNCENSTNTSLSEYLGVILTVCEQISGITNENIQKQTMLSTNTLKVWLLESILWQCTKTLSSTNTVSDQILGDDSDNVPHICVWILGCNYDSV